MDDAKTQTVRLLDVFVFGPLMIASGQSQRSKYFKHALTIVGIGTIVYNGARYLQARNENKTGDDAGLEGRATYTRPARH